MISCNIETQVSIYTSMFINTLFQDVKWSDHVLLEDCNMTESIIRANNFNFNVTFKRVLFPTVFISDTDFSENIEFVNCSFKDSEISSTNFEANVLFTRTNF